MKQILSFFVLVCVSLGAMASNTSVLNAEGVEIWYDFDSSAKTASVTYMGSSYYSHAYTGEVVIPSTVTYEGEEYSVTSIGDYAFYNCSSLTCITLPDGLTSIGYYAFRGCSSLTCITLPDGLTSIGDYAFKGCSSLTSLTLPDDLPWIGNNAFYNCYKLYEVYNKSDLTITAGSTDKGYVAYYAKNVFTDSEGESKLKTEGDYIFYVDGEDIELIAYTGSETSITLPSDYEGKNYNIGERAFEGCSSLASITLPDGLPSIGDYAFRNCSSLTGITLPDGLPSIGDYAFYNCYALTSITLPDGLTSIGNYAFDGCSSLTSITLPDGLTSIGDSAFKGCSSLTSITLPDDLPWIGNIAFYNCYKLYEVYNKSDLTITAGSSDNGYVACYAKNVFTDSEGESKLKTEGDYIFYVDGEDIELIAYTGSETSITLPSDYEGKNYNIGDYAFYGCYSLTSITLPEGVTEIGDYAFSDCNSLTSITLPDGLTSMGDEAFYNCSSLTSITLPDGLTSIGDYPFLGCSSLTSITLPDGLTSIGDDAFMDCYALTSITLPDGLTSIGERAFEGCSSLTSITLPDGLTSIGERAFHYCSSLTSITLPDGLTSIGDGTFSYCFSLTSITLPDGLTSIGEGAFYQCWWLKEIQIPNSVVTIGANAFYYCSGLTFLTLPSSVVSIGDDAFIKCYKLREIYNQSDLNIVAGSETYGNIAYYATNVYNEEGANKIKLIDNFVFYEDADNVVLLGQLTDDSVAVFPDTYCGKNYTIGEYAFEGHTFTSITLPDGLTSIGERAFSCCYSLASITSKNTTPPTLDYSYYGDTFTGVDKSIPVYVPAESVEAYKSAYGWNEFTNIQAIDETVSSIIDSTTDSITVRINGNEIVVEGTDNYIIYSISGQNLGKTESVEKGIYIVVVNGKSYKVIANK